MPSLDIHGFLDPPSPPIGHFVEYSLDDEEAAGRVVLRIRGRGRKKRVEIRWRVQWALQAVQKQPFDRAVLADMIARSGEDRFDAECEVTGDPDRLVISVQIT